MKKQIEISINEAKELYNNGGNDIKNLLLTTFTKEELESPKKPMSWGDLGKVEGYYVDSRSLILKTSGVCSKKENRNIFPKKEQAEASVALAQLLQLMKHPYWNGDWEPDWTDDTLKFRIRFQKEKIEVESYKAIKRLLAFPTKEKAKEFLESYRDLIETAKPLL